MTAINTNSYGWGTRNEGLSDPYRRLAVLTYSDTVDIVDASGVADPPRALYASASGNVVLLPIDNGSATVTIAVTAGQTVTMIVKRVLTATTVAAGSLLGCW